MFLIYDDQGASADSVSELQRFFQREKKPVETTSGKLLQKTNWQGQTTALIMPGGRSLPFYDALGEAGNQNIIDYVYNGGCYIGFCAGGYYACAKTVFAKGLPEELMLPGALNFFSGSAVGPVFAAEDFAYQSEQGARIVAVEIEGHTYQFYFNGGCYFLESHQQQVRILGCYQENKLPAIIEFTYGKGRVLLSGVHPELSYRTIPNNTISHHQYLRQTLLKVDMARYQFLRHMLSL